MSAHVTRLVDPKTKKPEDHLYRVECDDCGTAVSVLGRAAAFELRDQHACATTSSRSKVQV